MHILPIKIDEKNIIETHKLKLLNGSTMVIVYYYINEHFKQHKHIAFYADINASFVIEDMFGEEYGIGFTYP